LQWSESQPNRTAHSTMRGKTFTPTPPLSIRRCPIRPPVDGKSRANHHLEVEATIEWCGRANFMAFEQGSLSVRAAITLGAIELGGGGVRRGSE
jgi:hypothetical protein